MITVQLAKKPSAGWYIKRDGKWWKAPFPASTPEYAARAIVEANAVDVDKVEIVEYSE